MSFAVVPGMKKPMTTQNRQKSNAKKLCVLQVVISLICCWLGIELNNKRKYLNFQIDKIVNYTSKQSFI